MTEFEEYRETIEEDIRQTVGSKPVQPIIFAGSGLSIRYFSGPNWDSLLEEMAGKCPKLEHNYGYYRQDRSPQEVGQILSDRYARWAWDRNENKFQDVEPKIEESQDIYLKSEISEYFKNITPESISDISEDTVNDEIPAELAKSELKKLKEIQPHAVITTNYDRFLENIFNDGEDDDFEGEEKYNVIVGEEVIGSQYKSVGEILKIHGSVTDPKSLILTSDDYDKFNSRKMYLRSKMLTYFAEHPLLIVGYSASDPNVRKILSWVNQTLPEDRIMAEDIYFVEYDSEVEDRDHYPERKRIQLGKERYISVKGIVAKEFDWIFDAFSSGDGFEIDVRYLRKLIANTYEVVRSKTPEAKVVDHQRIEEAAEDTEELATVLGISAEDNNLSFEFNHDYRPTELYEEIGVDNAYNFKEKVLVPIYEKYGYNLTSFNNKYYISFPAESVTPRRYSEAAVEGFNDVLDGGDFEISIPDDRIPDEEPEDRGLDLSRHLED